MGLAMDCLMQINGMDALQGLVMGGHVLSITHGAGTITVSLWFDPETQLFVVESWKNPEVCQREMTCGSWGVAIGAFADITAEIETAREVLEGIQ